MITTKEAINTHINNNQLHYALDNVSSYIYMKDLNFNYIYGNELTLKLFNCSLEKLIGKDDFYFFSQETAKELREIDSKVLQGKKNEALVETKDQQGNKETYLEVKTPIYENKKSKKVVGLLGVSTNISENINLKNRLEEEKFNLQAILDTTKDGIAILNLKAEILFFNNSFLEMIEFEKKELLLKSYFDITSFKHIENVKEKFQTTIQNGYVENFEKSCITKNGKSIDVNISMSLMPDKKRVLISLKDITEIKKEKKLLEEYVELIDKNIITASIDLDGNFTNVSNAYCDITKYSKDELLGGKLKTLLSPESKEDIYEKLCLELKKDNIFKGELKKLKKDGTFYWVISTITPSYNEYNNKNGYTIIEQDITDKKIIEQISITDGLTNIYNRRYFNEIFPKEINKSKRCNDLVTFMIIDIDYFKQYNDTYGHQKGDDVLIKVSTTIKESLHRENDYCFRIGGEEFGVLIKVYSKKEAKNFAESLRKKIEDLKLEHINNKVSSYVTVSIGIYSKEAKSLIDKKDIFKEADDLLYEAKEKGRNQVRIKE